MHFNTPIDSNEKNNPNTLSVMDIPESGIFRDDRPFTNIEDYVHTSYQYMYTNIHVILKSVNFLQLQHSS